MQGATPVLDPARCPRVDVLVEHKEQQLQGSALLDSGSQVDLVSRQWIEQRRAEGQVVVTKQMPRLVRLADGREATLCEVMHVRMRLTLHRQRHVESSLLLHVMDQLPADILLGHPTLQTLGLLTWNVPLVGPDYAVDEEDFERDWVSAVESVTDDQLERMASVQFPERARLVSLLKEFRSLFSPRPDKAGAQIEPIRLVQKPGTVLPFHVARPLAEPLMKILQDFLNEMLELGIIVPSKAQHASPIVFVKKKDGTWRLTVDMRSVNACTEVEAWPIPRIDDLLQLMSLSLYFASMDLAQAFWQLPIHPDSQHFFAFSTPLGVFQFTRLPMGWHASTAIFQRSMQSVLAGIPTIGAGVDGAGATSYVDDLAVCASSEDLFLDLLRRVFTALQAANLRINPNKSIFGAASINHLGCVVSHRKVEVDPARLQSLREWPTPTDAAQVRRFLGAVGYIRSHLRNLGALARPLSRLTSAKVSWQWGEEEQEAFEQIKGVLADAAALSPPDYAHPLIMVTDASAKGVGAVLLQRIAGRTQFVAFASRALTEQEAAWNSCEHELYACIFGLKAFRGMLLGVPLIWETDCKALSYLTVDRGARLTRWRLTLLEYQITVRHVPGKDNIVCDAMSRAGDNVPGVAVVVGAEEAGASAGSDQQRQQSQEDPSPAWTVEKRRLLESVHGAQVGHWGKQATLAKLAMMNARYEGDEKDVEQWVRTCGICQKGRTAAASLAAANRVTMRKEPWDTVAMDAFGPIPEDEKGNRFVILMVDLFTRFVFLWAAVDLTAESAVDAIAHLVAWAGPPRCLQSDKGSLFTAEVTQRLADLLGVKQHFTTTAHPESNGSAERHGGIMLRAMRALVMEKRMERQWSRLLPVVQLQINSRVHKVTGTAPIRMLFPGITLHRGVLVPFALPTGESITVEDYVQQMAQFQQELWDRANEMQDKVIQKALGKIKENEPSFQEGDLVLARYPERAPSKLAPKMKGPLEVVERRDEVIYLTREVVPPFKEKEYHISQLVHYDDSRWSSQQSAILDDPNQFLIDHIVEHKNREVQRGKKKVRELCARVRWVGCGEEADTWEPVKELLHNESWKRYVERHPDLTVQGGVLERRKGGRRKAGM